MKISPIFSGTVDQLMTLVEEGARANPSKTDRFIEPAHGTLRRATNRRHHIIFGRRGSGKSSLLHKSSQDLQIKKCPVAYVDLEPFKGHQYPDVLLSVLLAAMQKFSDQIESLLPKKRNWLSLPLNRSKRAKEKQQTELLKHIKETTRQIEEQLHLADGASMVLEQKTANTQNKQSGINAKIGAGDSLGVEATQSETNERAQFRQLNEQYVRSKQDWLHRKIIDFQKIFRESSELFKCDAFLFLDDLYHIHRKDQASLVDYFHRIAKGQALWLKIGTIKNRSTWYINNPQPTGLKLGDDADEIDLDLTLEKFSISKKFLQDILATYVNEAGSPSIEDIMTDGGFDRLVLASGGVARDFLGLFRRSIDETRDRVAKSQRQTRGDKISAEDINLSAGGYGETKKEEFKLDTLEDRLRLEHAYAKIRLFCIDKSNCNILLVDSDLQDNDSKLVQELVDLRLIHHVRSRVTIPDRPGLVFRALMLDFSQYTGARARRDLEIVEFWKENKKDSIRRVSLIYNPSITEEQLLLEIERKKPSTQPTSESENELPLWGNEEQ